jgi:ABC-type branched-subunit amino acid transport system substrate-binding protein
MLWGLGLCLLLSACALPQSTKPVIKIGLVAPFEGRYRSLGYEVLYAVKWAVRQRNQAGGVAGYMVELVALDDGDDPATSAFQAYEFDVDADVMGVVGPFSEATISAAAPIYGQLGLAMVTPATCGPVEPEGVFCLGADVEVLARALVDRLPPGAQVTLLQVGEGSLGDRLRPAAQHTFVGPWEEKALVRTLAGATPNPPIPQPPNHPTTQPPNSLYLYDGDVLSVATLLIEMRANGVDAPLWGGPSLARTQLPQIAGEAAAGACYAITAPLYADLSTESAFAAGYRELGGTSPGPWAALAYDATYLLLDALEKAIQADGEPSRQGVIAQLGNVRGPEGQLLFAQGRRRQPETTFSCYGPGEGYPGHVSTR